MRAYSSLTGLPSKWRERGDALRQYGGAEGPARAWEQAALELETALRAHDDEPLSLAAAAADSGYSADHLARMVRDGKIPNAGRHGAPLVRRGDLPMKRSHLRTSGAEVQLPDVSLRRIAQSIVTRS